MIERLSRVYKENRRLCTDNEQLRREKAALLRALALIHDFYTMDTATFVEKHGVGITSKQAHDTARAVIATVWGEEEVLMENEAATDSDDMDDLASWELQD